MGEDKRPCSRVPIRYPDRTGWLLVDALEPSRMFTHSSRIRTAQCMCTEFDNGASEGRVLGRPALGTLHHIALSPMSRPQSLQASQCDFSSSRSREEVMALRAATGETYSRGRQESPRGGLRCSEAPSNSIVLCCSRVAFRRSAHSNDDIFRPPEVRLRC